MFLSYIPTPGDDETFGSWLARISFHVGKGAWIALLRLAGYRGRIEKSYFDVAGFDKKLAALLTILGTTYTEVLMKMTVLPYWLAFDAESLSHGPLEGTFDIPRIGDRKTYDAGFTHSKERVRAPRWCSICLESDIKSIGEPYWHRVHQLPNVFVCWKHGCALRVRCPACGRAMTPSAKHLTAPPQLQCECGQDLRTCQDFPVISEAYRRLVQISRDALECRAITWDHARVQQYFRSLMAIRTEIAKGAYRSMFEQAFHVSCRRSLGVLMDGKNPESPRSVEGDTLALRRWFSCMRAPEFCALLAASGIDFATACRNFQRVPSPEIISTAGFSILRRREGMDKASDIVAARREMLASGGAEGPAHSVRAKTYWILRLFDPEWLKTTYPRSCRGTVPTIYEDRMAISRIVRSESLPAAKLHRIEVVACTMRASLRDSTWLSGQIEILRTLKANKRNTRAREQRERRVAYLYRALFKILREEQRPVRITYYELGRLSGLNPNQVIHIVHSDSLLHQVIEQANADKPRRQLLWAGRQLQLQDRLISFKKVCAAASLPQTASIMKLKQSIMEQLLSVAPGENVGTISSTMPPGPASKGLAQWLNPAIVCLLREHGWTFARIGSVLGVCETTVGEAYRKSTGTLPRRQTCACTSAEVKQLRAQGLTIRSIATELHVAPSTVRTRLMSDLAGRRPRPQRSWRGYYYKDVLSRARDGKTPQQICADLGCSRGHLATMLSAMRAIGIEGLGSYRGKVMGGRNMARLVELKDQGISKKTIAKMEGISGSSADELIQAYEELVLGRDFKAAPSTRTATVVNSIRDLKNSGKSIAEISRLLDMGRCSVRRSLLSNPDYKRRPREKFDKAEIKRLRELGNSVSSIALRLGASPSTVYQALAEEPAVDPRSLRIHA